MKKLGATAVLFFVTASMAHADGMGTRGGGQIVDVDKNPVLRDFVDKTDCDWYKGDEVAATLPHFPSIISVLSNVHWYFADVIQNEPSNLRICETKADLKSISTEDVDGVGATATDSAEPVAIRINNSVYLSMPVFNKLDAVNQAYVLLHETMHSFIKWGADQRNTKLRSFIASIHTLETTGMTSQHFRDQMDRDSITIPAQTPILDHEADFKTVVDTTLSNDQRLDAVVRIVGKNLLSYQNFSKIPDAILSNFGDTSYGPTVFGTEATDVVNNFMGSAADRIAAAIAKGDVDTLKNILVDRQFDMSGFILSSCAQVNGYNSDSVGCEDSQLSSERVPLIPGLAGDLSRTSVYATPLGYAVLMRQPAVVSLLVRAGYTSSDTDYVVDESVKSTSFFQSHLLAQTESWGNNHHQLSALEVAQRLRYNDVVKALKGN